MVAKDQNKTKESIKLKVGEIDTSAPFRSVKDAVTLFGESAFSGGKLVRKGKPQSQERVVAKETELLLVPSELDGLKDKLMNAEITKADALIELLRAKETVKDLTEKLETLNKAKDSANAKQFAEEGNRNSARVDGVMNVVDPRTGRVEFETVVSELDEATCDLRRIRQEYRALMEAKNEADKQGCEAERAVKVSMARAEEISREIVGVEDSVQEEMLESGRVKEEEAMMCVDKENQKQLHEKRLGELTEQLLALKENIDPELIMNLETRLGDNSLEIEALRNAMENKNVADHDSLNSLSLELVIAKELLRNAAEEESFLRCMEESLKVELCNTKDEHSELKERERKTESSLGNLHVKLRKVRTELEEAFAEECKARGASDEMLATIHQLVLESSKAEIEAEEMKRRAEELREQAEETRIKLEVAEKELEVAIHEAEEAKAAEARALEQIQVIPEKIGTETEIRLTMRELESLRKKVEDSEKLAELKVAAAVAQVEAVKASENEAVMRLEATQKEIEEMKAATIESLKKAEMAESARKVVEGELRKWRERELKKAAESAARILAESEGSFASSPSNNHKWKKMPQEKVMDTGKLEKKRPSISKTMLMPNLVGVMHKSNQVLGSPST